MNRLAPPGGALEAALALAGRIVQNAPLAVEMSKRIVSESGTWPSAETWDRQAPLVESVLATGDAREGARAFAEKRIPRWSGS